MLAFLDESARILRLLGALGLLICAGRVAWLSGTRLMERSAGTSSAPATGGSALQRLLSPPPASDHRPDLAALQEKPETGSGPAELSMTPPPVARRRAILVDLGPERSPVYVNGAKVGRTPYGGEVLCVEGEKIKVEVLPPQGLPLTQILFCQGQSIESRK